MTGRVIPDGVGGDPDDAGRYVAGPGGAGLQDLEDAGLQDAGLEDADFEDAGLDDLFVDDGGGHDDFLLTDDEFDQFDEFDEFDDGAGDGTGDRPAPAEPQPSGPPPAAPRRHLVIDDFEGMDEPLVRPAGSARFAAAVPPASDLAGSGRVGPVVIDGTDDLPDAIALSDTRRDGGNLLIGDEDDLSALVLPDERPKMNPKVRQRRISVRRGLGRKRLKWVLLLGIPLLLVVGALAMLASPLFSVETITVEGIVHTPADQLEAIIGPLRGEPVLTIDTHQVERRLEGLAWVRRAAVDADFPRSLHVSIVERIPVAAYVGSDGSWRVIDIDGGVIDIVPDGAQPADFLPILGPGPDLLPGQNAGSAYQTLAQLAATLDALPTLRPLVVSISVAGPDINLALSTGASVDLGSASELRQKLAVLLSLLADPERDVAEIVSINVSDPSKPAIQ